MHAKLTLNMQVKQLDEDGVLLRKVHAEERLIIIEYLLT